MSHHLRREEVKSWEQEDQEKPDDEVSLYQKSTTLAGEARLGLKGQTIV